MRPYEDLQTDYRQSSGSNRGCACAVVDFQCDGQDFSL